LEDEGPPFVKGGEGGKGLKGQKGTAFNRGEKHRKGGEMSHYSRIRYYHADDGEKAQGGRKTKRHDRRH